MKTLLLSFACVLIYLSSHSLWANPDGEEAAGTIERAQFTTAIENREPVDQLTQVGDELERVYFYTEIHNRADTSITHRWSHDGKLASDVTLDIGADRWRTWSSKGMDPSRAGEWTVDVLDEDGRVLGSWQFEYQPE